MPERKPFELKKWNPRPEVYKVPKTPIEVEIQCLSAVDFDVWCLWKHVDPRSAMRCMIMFGIKSIRNLVFDGKEVKDGGALWQALNAADNEHTDILDGLYEELVKKNTITEEVSKNS